VSSTRVGLEIGSTWVFATAVHWPGWDDEPREAGELTRLLGLLRSSWRGFDGAVTAAPSALPKGPRGGGRDRDDIVEHVREAARSHARKVGVRVPPRTAWSEQRAAITYTLLHAGAGTTTVSPFRYFIRRTAWHVLDHARELEDKSR